MLWFDGCWCGEDQWIEDKCCLWQVHRPATLGYPCRFPPNPISLHYHKKAELMGSVWEAHENSVPVVKVPANAGEYVHATWIQMSRKETRGHPNGLYSIVGHHLHGIICYGLVWARLVGRAKSNSHQLLELPCLQASQQSDTGQVMSWMSWQQHELEEEIHQISLKPQF